MGLVEEAGSLGVGVEAAGVECPPRAVVGGLAEVGDQHVGVEQRVAGARDAVDEGRGDRACRRQSLSSLLCKWPWLG